MIAPAAPAAPKRRNGSVPSPVKAGRHDARLLALVAKGLDHVEIAARMGCRSGAVRARLRALRDEGRV